MPKRSIKQALNKTINEKIFIEDYIKDATQSMQYKKLAATKKYKYECLECGQDLYISNNKYNRIYFSHYNDHNTCSLTGNNYKENEIKLIEDHLSRRESDDHKQIKNGVANFLKSNKKVDENSIIVDTRFLYFNGKKKKPDVYCEMGDLKIVFEIQLSKLPLQYILDRFTFYKKNKIYLIWINKDFRTIEQKNFQVEIKYLNTYENFFVFSLANSRLLCKYKYNFIDKKKVKSRWHTKDISLNNLKFDNEYQVYYFDYSTDKLNKESYLSNLIVEERKQKRLRDLEKKFNEKIKRQKDKINNLLKFRS